jgi:ABC-type multidrug transport system fused ATPase/permease subunit
MAFGLFFVDTYTALLTFLLLGLAAALLHALMQKRARRLGEMNSKLTIEGNSLILQVLDSYREATVRNRRTFYAKKIGDSRMNLANLAAEMTFMPNISKYTIEITMVISALFIAAFQFIFYDASSAIATLAVFLTASARIGPAILRMQQGLIQMKVSIGSARPTLELINRLEQIDDLQNEVSPLQTTYVGFSGEISVKNLELVYPGKKSSALSDVNLEIKPGQLVAFVGPSGAGKTSLVDVILGIIKPTKGEVTISNLAPSEAIKTWPGSIAYVPQDVFILDGTIKENVALGFEGDDISDDLVWDALRRAQLDEVVSSLPNKIEEQVGERGSKLSGGQRQRLGVARALYTKPRVIVLDEATSALDGETEAKLEATINELRGEITVIMIAHRLSTVRNSDTVVYLESGNLISTGNFDEVRKMVPKFEYQAKLMGL